MALVVVTQQWTVLSEEIETWVERHRDVLTPADASRAILAVDRVLAEDSELRDLWKETDSWDEWLAGINDLKQRLSSAPSA